MTAAPISDKPVRTKRRAGLPAAALLCLCSLLGLAAVLLAQPPAQPAFAPPPFEAAAQQGEPQPPAHLGWGELDTGVFCASVCGVPQLQGQTAEIWLTNPGKNTVWLKLRLLDEQGAVLGETGLLRPGEYVRSADLLYAPAPGQAVQLRLMAYEPDTYHSAGSVTLHARFQ